MLIDAAGCDVHECGHCMACTAETELDRLIHVNEALNKVSRYRVVCEGDAPGTGRDRGKEPMLATRRTFPSYEAALGYAMGIDPGRHPEVLPVLVGNAAPNYGTHELSETYASNWRSWMEKRRKNGG